MRVTPPINALMLLVSKSWKPQMECTFNCRLPTESGEHWAESMDIERLYHALNPILYANANGISCKSVLVQRIRQERSTHQDLQYQQQTALLTMPHSAHATLNRSHDRHTAKHISTNEGDLQTGGKLPLVSTSMGIIAMLKCASPKPLSTWSSST